MREAEEEKKRSSSNESCSISQDNGVVRCSKQFYSEFLALAKSDSVGETCYAKLDFRNVLPALLSACCLPSSTIIFSIRTSNFVYKCQTDRFRLISRPSCIVHTDIIETILKLFRINARKSIQNTYSISFLQKCSQFIMNTVQKTLQMCYEYIF